MPPAAGATERGRAVVGRLGRLPFRAHSPTRCVHAGDRGHRIGHAERMAGSSHAADSAGPQVQGALADGRRRAGVDRARPVAGAHALLAMQRNVGNAAVSALVAAKLRSPGDQAIGSIDAALKEIGRSEPAVDTVEEGLRAAKAAGVPVELEGPKPPAAALAVTKTGFGPGSVPAKKPVPPAKPIPAVSPLGKAGAAAPKVGGKPGGA